MNYEVIKINVDSDIEEVLEINKQIFKDFKIFKTKNELLFCSLHIDKELDFRNNNQASVVWKTTQKYKNQKEVYDKIEKDFESFSATNSNLRCQISKVNCQEDTYVVEYSVYLHYLIDYV